jgi:ribosome biogenesis protein ENP2
MSNIQIAEINGMKIYNLTGGKTLYELMKESHFSVKKLKKNQEYTNRIEILQDCTFPVSSECIRISKDGNYLFASGIYPPRLKIFDFKEMSLKCERGFDSQIRKIEIISDDYKKCAMLCEDRNIELHAQYGKHFKIRIPKYGRDIKYDPIYCDLFSCGTGNEIYRLNLHEGQFLQSFETKVIGINSLGYNQPLELLGCACENGIVELFDLRSKKNCYSFDDFNCDLTSINFSSDGLNMAIGNNEGVVNVFDMRNSKPLYSINHAYGLPIIKILFDDNSKNIITVDKKIAKFSNYKNGKSFTNIEPKYDINDFEIYPNSGMFFFGCESEKVEIYFIPQLGPSPKWASFLDNITEELEEAKNYSLFEDYKFLTEKELDELGAQNLIGTKLVKPFMHGYFMDFKLYKKLRDLNQPFSYKEYLQKRKEEKMEKLLSDRIVFNKGKKPKINSKLLNNENVNEKSNVNLNDPRFAELFNNKEYAIDFTSDKFKKKNKNLKVNDDENEINEELKKIEVKNKKDKDKDEDNIVNKEILKLNQKLLQKKRKKIQKFHQGYDIDNNENFEERLNKNELEEDDNEQEFEIENKIRSLENKKAYNIEKNKKQKQNEELMKGRRIAASINQLSKQKLH